MKDFVLEDSLLGRHISSPEKYDASLLFRIPRSENRNRYNIDASHLPFVGYDVWNCYEISFLTNNGLPVSRIMKIMYSAESQYIVESKSLKLYLYSFNMDHFGKTVEEAIRRVEETIQIDLEQLLQTTVHISFFDVNSKVEKPFPTLQQADLCNMVTLEKLESMTFTRFVESPELLAGKLTNEEHIYSFRTDLLRSNCMVTNQPDWGDLFLQITTKYEIDLSSIVSYLISFRKENHFHEEVLEMIYKRFYDIFEPEKLMVAALYTRRGGIDINPIRASHLELIDEALINMKVRMEKTLRQ